MLLAVVNSSVPLVPAEFSSDTAPELITGSHDQNTSAGYHESDYLFVIPEHLCFGYYGWRKFHDYRVTGLVKTLIFKVLDLDERL